VQFHCFIGCVQAGTVVKAVDDTIAKRRTIIEDAAARGAGDLSDRPELVLSRTTLFPKLRIGYKANEAAKQSCGAR
jgi:hypothetical protein